MSDNSSIKSSDFDMVVSLYGLDDVSCPQGIVIKRAYIGDKDIIMKYIEDNFSSRWEYEAEKAMMQDVSKCFVAVRGSEIVGFACFDSAAKGFFGPIGVSSEFRGTSIGKALLITTLNAMREYGYGYAIIGWVNEAEGFYKKAAGAIRIEGSNPGKGVYSQLI